MKNKLRIVLKNGDVREYESNTFTEYLWRSEVFVVINGDQWIGIFNWDEVREVLLVDEAET